MFGETTIFFVMIWNHPVETTIKNWLFGVPGRTYVQHHWIIAVLGITDEMLGTILRSDSAKPQSMLRYPPDISAPPFYTLKKMYKRIQMVRLYLHTHLQTWHPAGFAQIELHLHLCWESNNSNSCSWPRNQSISEDLGKFMQIQGYSLVIHSFIYPEKCKT